MILRSTQELSVVSINTYPSGQYRFRIRIYTSPNLRSCLWHKRKLIGGESGPHVRSTDADTSQQSIHHHGLSMQSYGRFRRRAWQYHLDEYTTLPRRDLCILPPDIHFKLKFWRGWVAFAEVDRTSLLFPFSTRISCILPVWQGNFR